MQQLTTREKIIDLARNLMQTIGYHSFNYKQIATQLNIKNASIHHYFPAKEDLALAVINQDKEDFGTLTAHVKSSAPSEKVKALLDNYVQFYKNGKKLCVISTFGTSFNDVSDKIQMAASGYGKIVNNWFEEVLTEGLKTGEFTFKDDVKGVAALWMATLPGSLLVGRLHGDAYFDQTIKRLQQSLKN